MLEFLKNNMNFLLQQVMDYKVADLRKKLNKLKYETSTKTDRIARLMKDYEKVVNMNAEIVSLSLMIVHRPQALCKLSFLM